MPYQQQLTDLGRDALSLAQTNLPLRFTKIELGEGETPMSGVPQMTSLVAPVMTSGIAEVSPRSIGQVTVTTKIAIATVPKVFDLCEIGLFASVGNQPEVLYAVCVAERQQSEIISPSMPGGSTNEHTISIAVLIGSTTEVEAVFDPDVRVTNIGGPEVGAGFYSRRTGNTFEFKRAVQQGGIAITEDATTVRFNVTSQIPVGAMMPYAAVGGVPAGWLLCNGAWYPRSSYPTLASLLGSIYGGDTNSFAVPDCRDRTLVGVSGSKGLGHRAGAETHTLSVAEMPWHGHGIVLTDYGHVHGIGDGSHAHSIHDPQHVHSVNTIADIWWREGTGRQERFAPVVDFPFTTTYFARTNIQINAAFANISMHPAQSNIAVTLYGEGGSQPHSNMPPYLAINYIIRAV